jgi:lipopolysaccharide export LptBFGC system permease protein LptF
MAFCFMNFDNRKSTIKTTTLVLVTGIFAYFYLEISSRILAYGGLSPIFATLLPILFIILIGNFVILHLQEL